MTNEFWAFSLVAYAADGVADGALAVQDEMGLDVNVLLYAGWLASRNQILSSAHLVALEARIDLWRRRVVLPLRALRRALRDYPEASVIRERIKALELQSERQQQDMMWEFYNSEGPLAAGVCPLRDNLGLLVESVEVNPAVWEALLERMARAVETVVTGLA